MITRRRLLAGTLAAAAAGQGCARERVEAAPPGRSSVAILRAPAYHSELAGELARGAAMCGLNPRGLRVLLKPNLVEFDSAQAINTHVAVLSAVVELFEKLGAAEVRIGEGPGHRRDTLYLAGEAGYRRGIADFDRRFVDLNLDDVARRSFVGDQQIYLPQSAIDADLVVSVAKMKTHHWAGATLSMKNFFGLVPGAVYGWPKNWLHQIGIDRSVAALYGLFPRSFAIIDGVVGMEGNGPIQGTAKPAGVLVMGHDLVAVDATCCRVMGIDPEQIRYLRMASGLGHSAATLIDQRGESIRSMRTDFELPREFADARLA